ncbi:lnt, apolipo protein N-acyltransferase [Mycena galericulata]|nr:lnt, apolipo protein N-acyltransferase [Mycena galericulata]
MSPSFIPLTFTVASLLLYAPILFHRRQYGYAALLWLCIALFSAFGRLVPALTALSTSTTSLAVLFAASSLTSALAIMAIGVDVFLCTHITGANQAVLFPAIWTTLWAVSSRISPLGRLTSWSPVLGTQSYSWMTAWVGPAGIDWVVAAWAVVISQSIGSWYMGNSEDEMGTKKKASASGTGVATVFLIALTIPSFLLSGLPLPVYPIESTSRLSVGCALPPFSKYNHTTPTLDDYVSESKSLDAKIILWPEGAVSFHSASDRDAGFHSISELIGAEHTYWAISFEEDVADPSDVSGRTSIRHTGLALLSNSQVLVKYYKRHLVPIAESFSLTPGSVPPFIYDLPLNPPKNMKPHRWAPNEPNGTRPIALTASICLDFAMPSPFRELDSKPALILAPARTWDPVIGFRMWEEVKQRANEIGSLALWCDGGEGGVSGVAGGGYNDVYQVGEGSWSRTIGIQYPFVSSGTLYARFGDTLAFAAAWLLVIGPAGLWLLFPRYKMAGRHLHGVQVKCVNWFVQKTRRRQPLGVAQPQPNLIDFSEG